MFEQLKFDRSTVPNKIVEEVKGFIQRGELKPGEQLPPERDLAQLLNVSRNTIRESYKVLSTLGLIEIKHGQGAFVAKEHTNLHSFAGQFFIKGDQYTDLFEIRKLIETQAVVWAVERASDQQLDDLYVYVKKTIQLMESKELDKSDLSNRDHQFHLEISKPSHNELAFRMMNILTGQLSKMRKETAKIPERLQDSWNEHLKITEMLKARNAEKAREYMEIHLDSVEQTLKAGTKEGGSKCE
ncbi:FadR/GntR family transcriptional regulator [Bacillus sp. USDA818B3_A]|uniref:FadR/GntR family transcriptional regulator n=1 Tax=Bacillus sp. USDA818B3_A TaxID=2698834 RepID=UPI00136EBAA9|nr:FadR/GntR family transcriptional regulator [Bacillus sp. USDA818B3_A]